MNFNYTIIFFYFILVLSNSCTNSNKNNTINESGSNICINCPDWEDSPGSYEHTSYMVVGIVLNDNCIQLGDSGDEFAALDDDGNVRGVGVMLDVDFGLYAGTSVYEMTIRSNDIGEILSFQYYDASEDVILQISETYEFQINEQLGNLITGAMVYTLDGVDCNN